MRGVILFFSGAGHRALDPEAKTSSGGAELQVALLAKALAKRGERCVIAAADPSLGQGKDFSGVRVLHAGPYDTGKPLDTILALWPVSRVLAAERPRVVIVYGWTSWLAILCVLGKILGFQVVFVCALDGEANGRFRRENPLRGCLFEWGVRHAAARVSITEHQCQCFRAKGMSCSVTRLLLAEEPDPSPRHKEFDLLWVARCHPVKRPELFLQLAADHPDLHCRMICSPQDRELWSSIRAQASELKNVEFLDGVPYREIQSHFDAARIFVNTSEDEGVPNTFLHSAAAGAAIGSLNSDPDGMLGKFGCGFASGGVVEELGDGICRLLRDPVALTAAAEGGARFLREWHDNDKNTESFLSGLPQPQ